MANEKEKYVHENTKTSHKRWESMVMYALHFALRDTRLESQYPVESYLLDGYFPDIKLAVEIDEPHHKTIVEADGKREERIKNKLGCEFFRIDVEKDVYPQIDELIEKVKELDPPMWTIQPKREGLRTGEFSAKRLAGLEESKTAEFIESLRADLERMGIKTYECTITGHIPATNGYLGFMVGFDGIEFSVASTKSHRPRVMVTNYADEEVVKNLDLELSSWKKGKEYKNIENIKWTEGADEVRKFFNKIQQKMEE